MTGHKLTYTPELDQLVDLTDTFRFALERKIGRANNLNQNIIATMTTAEQQSLQSLEKKVREDGLALVSIGGYDDDFLNNNLELTEKLTSVASRVMPAEELRKLLPPDLRNKISANQLSERNAPSLAALCV